MAFALQWLTRVEQTENLDKTTNPGSGMDTVTRPQQWNFNAGASGANGSKAQTVAADYFLGAYGYLNVGDLVYVYANDGAQQLVVTASSSVTVTTSAAWTV